VTPPKPSTVTARGCTGAACKELEFEAEGECVVALYRGAKSARLDAQLADQTITLYLEAPDAAKAEARAASLKDEQMAVQIYLQAKADLKREEDFVARMREQGADTRDIEFEQARNRKPLGPDPREVRHRREENGYHGQQWDPFAQRNAPVFIAPLRTETGCVDTPDAVLAWKIDFAERPAEVAEEDAGDHPGGSDAAWPADRLKFGCKGNGCGAINTDQLALDACEIGNRGKKPIMVIIRQKSGGQLKIASLEPEQFVRLSTPMGCVSLGDIAEIEATVN